MSRKRGVKQLENVGDMVIDEQCFLTVTCKQGGDNILHTLLCQTLLLETQFYNDSCSLSKIHIVGNIKIILLLVIDIYLHVSKLMVCDLNRRSIVMAKHGGSCVHFSGISTCGTTSRQTVSHPQRPPLPILYKYLYPSTLLWQINGCNL